MPENEATNDSISFEEVSVKQETPDFENMVQMEEVFGSDPIGIDNAESSAELTDASKTINIRKWLLRYMIDFI